MKPLKRPTHSYRPITFEEALVRRARLARRLGIGIIRHDYHSHEVVGENGTRSFIRYADVGFPGGRL